MCTPTGLLVGGLGLSGAQAIMGYQQGQSQAAYASAAAASGYAGAMQEYNQQMDFINRQEDWKWSEYQRQVAYRQEVVDFNLTRWEDTIAAVSQDFEGKLADLGSGLFQLRQATMASLQDIWLTHHKSQGTRKVNADRRGVEGPSVEAEQAEALRAMYVKEETALTNLEWAVEQGQRQAVGYQAAGQSTINQAEPGPMAQVAAPAPRPNLNMPTWAPYGIQAQAGAAQGMNTSMNALIGGVSGGLGSFGQYYQQTTPPAPTYTYNVNLA
tara:strand:+ start:4236 stop:5042 length:807 start_codon:yes stop_codon:yes gene_type:complete